MLIQKQILIQIYTPRLKNEESRGGFTDVSENMVSIQQSHAMLHFFSLFWPWLYYILKRKREDIFLLPYSFI